MQHLPPGGRVAGSGYRSNDARFGTYQPSSVSVTAKSAATDGVAPLAAEAMTGTLGISTLLARSIAQRQAGAVLFHHADQNRRRHLR